MGTACPTGEDVGEVAPVVYNTLQENIEVAIVVVEHLGSLDQAEDVEVGGIHSPHVVGEVHAAEASRHLVWVDKMDEAVGQDILEDQEYLPDGLSSCGLAQVKLVG